MHKPTSLFCKAALLSALSACAAQPLYSPAPRPKVDPLPADLRQMVDPMLCQRLLSMFSASQEVSRKTCGDTAP
jgi:hypothetical protein